MAHILIVDDEAHIRFLIHKVLESAGHSLFEAASGPEALDILDTHPYPFDVIVLDVRMPRMDGFEFLRRLRQQIPHMPVLLVTAHKETIPPEFQDERHLSKPFGTQKLIDMVNNLLAAPSV